MSLRSAALSLAVLLGLAWPASAQDTDFWTPTVVRVPVTAALVNANSLGYRLGPEVSVGLEVERGAFVSLTQATLGFRHKVETGDGREYALAQRLCGRRGLWLACGGVRYDDTHTSHWQKGAVRPTVGAGWQQTRGDGLYTRVLVDYEIGALDAANGLHGIDAEVRLGRPGFYFVAGAGIYRFHATGQPGMADGGARFYSGLGLDLARLR